MEWKDKADFKGYDNNHLNRLLTQYNDELKINKTVIDANKNILSKGTYQIGLDPLEINKIINVSNTNLLHCDRNIQLIKEVMNDRQDEVRNKPSSIDKSINITGDNNGTANTGDGATFIQESSIDNSETIKSNPNPINIKPIPMWLKVIGWIIGTGIVGLGVYISYLELTKSII